MAQTTLNVRMDAELKKGLEQFCADVGMNTSVLVTMFAKKVVREQKLPFKVGTDPFYSEANMERLRRGIAALNAGLGVEHELTEAEDE